MNKNNSFSLVKKVCVITGGAGLLGQAFSLACANSGATVIILDIHHSNGENVSKKISKESGNKQIYFYQCDLNNEKEVNDTLRVITKKFKTIDALVNNAYPRNENYGREFGAVTLKDFCENLSLHVGSFFYITQQVLKIMKKQRSGAIVNLGSIYGITAPDFSIYNNTTMTMPVEYAAIKGAVTNLSKYLASYAGSFNVRVNTLSPGGVANGQPASFIKEYVKRVRVGKRMATPQDLTGALIFLISDASSYITGQNIVVDGGWTL